MAEIVTGDLPNADQLPKVNLPESPIQESDDRGLVITISPPREDDDISASYLSARKDMNAMSHPAWQGAMDAGIDPGDTVADKPMFDRVETRTDGESKYHVGVNDDDPSTNVVLMVEDFVGDVVSGIGKGAVSGLQEAGEQIGDTLTGGFWSESIAPWLRENIPYLPEANVATQEMLKPEGTVQEVTQMVASPLAQVVAPGALLARTFRAAGIANRYLSEALGYGAAEIAAIKPTDSTLLELGIQLIDDSSEIRAILEASLGAQEDENAFIERLKNAPRRFLEGGPIGLVFERAIEGLGMAYRAIKNSPKYRGAIDVFNETAKAAQQGTFFSGIPTRPDVPASVGQIDEANRVIADDLVNRPELWGEGAPDINERREMVAAMLRGERFEGDEGVAQLFSDHAERLRIEQAEPAPGQDMTDFSLVRFRAPKGASERVQNLAVRLNDAPEAANKFRELARAGEEIGREWYNTEALAQRFVDVLGEDEGIAAFKEFIMLVGATSTGSKVQPNIRNASFYYTIGPEELKAIADDLLGGKFAPPKGSGYGHKMQKNQAGNVGKIVTGQWGPEADPRLNPKPRGFAQSLLGSNRNIAADKHFMRLMGMMSDDPAFLHNSAEISKTLIDQMRAEFGKSVDKFITSRMVNGKPAFNFNAKAAVLGSKKQKGRAGRRPIKGLYDFIKDKSSVWDDMPNDNEYAFLEEFAGKMADEMNMTAPQFQASLWMGAAKETGVDPSSLDTFMNIFDRILRQRANERGLTEQQVFEQFVKRQAPLMVPIVAGGVLAAGGEE